MTHLGKQINLDMKGVHLIKKMFRVNLTGGSLDDVWLCIKWKFDMAWRLLCMF